MTVTSSRWAGAPRRVRAVVAVTVVVLSWGTAVHVAHLIGAGLDPYPSVPAWLAAYFVSLTVLDPLAAVLLAWRRFAGLVLALAVLVTDALANAYANYVVDQSGGVTSGRVGQAVLTALAITLVIAAPSVAPWLVRGRAHRR